MRAFVTGATGFVGSWLTKELERAGHELVGASEVDVTDRSAVLRTLMEARPEAVVHLAAISSAPEALADPQMAFAVAVGGTMNLLEGARVLSHPPVILITGSAEVYGHVSADGLPLTETSALAPATPYALSKAAQEAVGVAYAAHFGLRVVVTRSFNHTGPGQRPVFVVPALAQRVLAAVRGQTPDVAVGNTDVRRDICDVRDVVVAYRLLLEAALANDIALGGQVVNVCSGRSVSIGWIVDELCRLAGARPTLRVDPGLVRSTEAPEIRGDPSLIQRLVGWTATTPISTTVADVWSWTVNSTLTPQATPSPEVRPTPGR
jgi:GDP-4-dehydro-6-deoxy-D-mannose reductase